MTTARIDIDWAKAHVKYLEGATLQDLGRELNCSHVSVKRNFAKRNLKILSLSEAMFRSKRNKGTSGKTRSTIKINGKRILLSHYNWCVANQFPCIPKNFIIHHRDNNRHNNNSENLVLLPDAWHKSLHYNFELSRNPKRNHWGINQIKEA